MEPVFEFPLDLPPRGSRQILRALHGQLRAAILDGRLRPGLRLPSTRVVAQTLGVARNTALAAYDLLLSEGYLITRRGAGAYVADVLPSAPERPASRAATIGDQRLAAHWRKPPALTRAPPSPPPRWSFRLGVPELAYVRFDVWRRLSARALRALARSSVPPAEPQGQPALREAIAKHVSFARAVACSSADIVVTAGAQQAFDLLARILVTPGRTVVALENPCYPPTRAAFAAAGARIVPVRVDEEGLVVERLPADARVICVTPSHQFPLGTVLSPRRRTALLEHAQRCGAVIIEDDYDGEFRFGGRPLDALQTLDRGASVFYVGTFSKCLFSAIRLGFVVAPPWARRALVAARQCADWCGNTLAQDTLAAFITGGHLARHVRKMRNIYGARRQVLLERLQRDFGRWLVPIESSAGLHLTVRTASAADADAIAAQALALGLGVRSLGDFYTGRQTVPGLALGYGSIDEQGIAEGLARLRRIWR